MYCLQKYNNSLLTTEANYMLHTRALTFSLEGEVAVGAVVWPDIGVGADVFAQHAGFLTADPTLLTDVFTTPAPTNINILLIGFESAGLPK